MADDSGVIFGVQRFSVHDGPGIRTTVFFKGCNMRCLWCHNPEGLSFEPELMFNSALCARCGACVSACPNGAHLLTDGAHSLDRTKCIRCGACAEACPNRALEISGARVTVQELLNRLMRDARYYRESGGGVTLSGGEALLQRPFAVALLKAVKESGVHTAVETNGACDFDAYREAAPNTDLFLFDFKHFDSGAHRRCTGLGNERVLENLERLLDSGARVLLRCPIILGVNDMPAHFEAIALLTRKYPALIGAQLLAYHDAGRNKAARLGTEMPEFKTPEPGALDKWKAAALGYGARLYE